MSSTYFCVFFTSFLHLPKLNYPKMYQEVFVEFVFAGSIGVGILFYLVYALLNPEKF
jgi:K+-transporting ATPase KdpF subunit